MPKTIESPLDHLYEASMTAPPMRSAAAESSKSEANISISIIMMPVGSVKKPTAPSAPKPSIPKAAQLILPEI